MWDRITWLWLWVTLAFWSGCAMDDQNYQINDDRSPLFEESYPTQPGGDTIQPSVTGLDRSDWPTTAVGPVRGGVPHARLYFRHEDEGGARPSPLTRNSDDIQARALAATSGAYEPPHTGKYGHIVRETLRYGGDVALWPLRASMGESVDEFLGSLRFQPISKRHPPRP